MTATCPTCRQPVTLPPSPPPPARTPRQQLLAELAADGGLTVRAYARTLYGDTPTRSQIERARGILREATQAGVLQQWDESVDGGPAHAVYRPAFPPAKHDLAYLLSVTKVQSPRSAACYLYDTERPRPVQVAMAERRLDHLVRDGVAVRTETPAGEARYRPTEAAATV